MQHTQLHEYRRILAYAILTHSVVVVFYLVGFLYEIRSETLSNNSNRKYLHICENLIIIFTMLAIMLIYKRNRMESKLIRKLKGKFGQDYANMLIHKFQTTWNLDFDESEDFDTDYSEAELEFMDKRYARICKVAQIQTAEEIAQKMFEDRNSADPEIRAAAQERLRLQLEKQ